MGLGDDQAARDNVLRTIDKFDKVGEAGRSRAADQRPLGCLWCLHRRCRPQRGSGRAGDCLPDLQRQMDSRQDIREPARGRWGLQGWGRGRLASWSRSAICWLRVAMALTGSRLTPPSCAALGITLARCIEAELTFEILDDKGRKRQFGSVSGGGRYDDLVKRFTGQEVPATGRLDWSGPPAGSPA